MTNIQLYPNGFLYFVHILLRENTGLTEESFLANGGQLVRHSLAFFSFKKYYCFAGIELIRLTGKRDNLNSIEKPVG